MSRNVLNLRREALRLTALIIGFAAVAAVANTPLVASQKHSAFSPGVISLTPGETLTVGNDDRMTHRLYVESAALKFDAGDQGPGRNVAITFAQAGDYEVLCAVHPEMKLTVHVQ
jgi:plastocyanin